MTIRPYSYYLIDLDRTLWDFDRNSEHAITLLIGRSPKLTEAVRDPHEFYRRYDKYNHELWAEYERGRLDKATMRWKRFYNAFQWYGVEDEALARRFGEEYLEQMVWEKELMPGARQMLENIRRAGGRMAILSNGFKEVQYRKLHRSGLEEFFSAVVVSEEAGCLKPRPGIFAYALEILSGAGRYSAPRKWKELKRQTLMIGDDPANDILGAQVFGIDQFYYNHKGVKALSHPTYESPDLTPFLSQPDFPEI